MIFAGKDWDRERDPDRASRAERQYRRNPGAPADPTVDMVEWNVSVVPTGAAYGYGSETARIGSFI